MLCSVRLNHIYCLILHTSTLLCVYSSVRCFIWDMQIREHPWLWYIPQDPDYCKDADALYRYMEQNNLLITKVIEELHLCCDYYDVEYCKERNAVLFREHIFHNINELREVFLEDFRKLDISDDEIFRIFEEESDHFYQSEFNKIQT